MADVLVDTILGRDDQMDPTTLDIGLIITDRALFSPDDGEIAQVEGYGAVPAEAVREQLRAALRDPKTPQEDRYGPDGPTVAAGRDRWTTNPPGAGRVPANGRARCSRPPGAVSCRGA